MGKKFFDQFTYLHFATGIISYFWGISFESFILFHTIFEIFENTSLGMNIINKYFTFWPGGKNFKDSNINIIGDTIGAILGWLSAYLIDNLGNKYEWYELHIKKKSKLFTLN